MKYIINARFCSISTVNLSFLNKFCYIANGILPIKLPALCKIYFRRTWLSNNNNKMLNTNVSSMARTNNSNDPSYDIRRNPNPHYAHDECKEVPRF